MNPGYFRFATVAGNTIVFVCEDSLWTVPAEGGTARRLTAEPGRIETPRLSPDGSRLAFVSWSEGTPEIYLMEAGGGPVRRLTNLGTEICRLSCWNAAGTELFFSSNAGSPFFRQTFGYRLATGGGPPVALDLGHVLTLGVRGDGRLLVGRNNDDPAHWKRYRGGRAGEIWVENGEGVFTRILDSLAGNLVWPMWAGDRVAFLSDHEGVGNLYTAEPDGGDLRRLTNETEYFARFPSTDGSRIVYTAGGDVRVVDLASGEVRTVAIDAPSTAPQTARRFIPAAEYLEDFEASPDGTAIAFTSRGSAFTMPLWEEAVVEHGEGSRVRQRCAVWLHDSERIACISDAGGRERVEIHHAQREEAPAIGIDEDFGRAVEMAASPVADLIAIANHRHELVLADLGEKRTRVVDRSPAGHIRDIEFSPDGRWIAYAYAPVPNASIIRVAKVKSGAVHDVTPLLSFDVAPTWDPEGRYLYFIGQRDFNPVYDAFQFELSFPQASRPFAVALRDGVPSPFVPKPAPLHKEHQHGEDDEDRKKDAKPERVDIDFEGIQGRLIGFPLDEGNYGDIVAVRKRVYFTKFPLKGIKPGGGHDDDGGGALMAYDFDQLRSASIAQDVSEIRLAADRRTLVYSSQDKLRAIDAGMDLPGEDEGGDNKDNTEPGRRTGWLDLSRASVMVEPPDEWAQMYFEAWRMQTEQFWDEAMSGVDWELARERYAKLLPRLRARSELSDLLWELQGELGTSHAYESGGDHPEPPQYRQGFLGADFAWDAALGGYRVTRRYRGDSWERDQDSPLAEPGQEVHEGEAIVAVNGRALSESRGLDAALVNAAGKEVVLTVSSGKRERRRAIVKTIKSERMLRYRAWVNANRALVHERTQGKVGYLHIPDMLAWGFAEFHRGFLAEFDREALVVDARFNRGGHVSPLLLEKLARKRIGYDVVRHGPPVAYPYESVAGPIVAICNAFSASDGDIFSHAFKLYKLGPLVGKRTWGGVIGINPYHALVDGTETTQPEGSFWFVDVGWGVENHGTDPDYDVDIAPHEAREGRDPQLERALELIAQMRAAHPNGKPHFDARPQLTIPTALAHAPASN